MEELIIPGWAVLLIGSFGAAFISWMVWLTLKTLHNESAIALNTAADQHVGVELEKIYQSIDKQTRSTNSRLDKMDNKLDLFLSQELSFLKQFANR